MKFYNFEDSCDSVFDEIDCELVYLKMFYELMLIFFSNSYFLYFGESVELDKDSGIFIDCLCIFNLRLFRFLRWIDLCLSGI